MEKRKGLSKPEHLDRFNYDEDLGDAGQYPFTRGVYPTMYRGRLWTMRQYSGFGGAEQTNRRFRYLLDQGQTGLSVAFDLPTQLGYDSDHPYAVGEVGRVGVALSSFEDFTTLFSNIPMDRVSTSMTINATAPVLMAMYIVMAKKNHMDIAKLQGTVQNDILKEFLARGNYIYPIRPSIRMTIDLWEYCIKNLPKWNMVSISGYHIREAGATAVQELAFTFANALCYVDAALDRGMDIDEFAPRISFFFSAHNNVLEEVAKFRAARRLWARLMKNKYKAKNPKSWMLRFHTHTCGSTLTANQPLNNIARVTLQALSAVLGGTQSLHTNSYDEALALPTEKASTIALRTQQIIAFESGLTDVIDPLAGSYTLESLTNRLECETRVILEKIESQGGAIFCLENGFMRAMIDDSAFQQQKMLEQGGKKVVGVNSFQTDESPKIQLLKVSRELESQRIDMLRKYRSKRDNKKTGNVIADLASAASGDENLMELIIQSIEADVTLGEICDTLREVFGTYDK